MPEQLSRHVFLWRSLQINKLNLLKHIAEAVSMLLNSFISPQHLLYHTPSLLCESTRAESQVN